MCLPPVSFPTPKTDQLTLLFGGGVDVSFPFTGYSLEHLGAVGGPWGLQEAGSLVRARVKFGVVNGWNLGLGVKFRHTRASLQLVTN